MKRIITIGREFGSGGHEIAERISQKLNYTLYDKEIISEVARQSGINIKELQLRDEKGMNSLLYALALGNYYKGTDKNSVERPVSMRIEQAYFETIARLAEKTPCIIVGRAADYILRNNAERISFFITAKPDKKISRICEKYNLTATEASRLIEKNDRNRSTYYKSVTGNTWGTASCYDFCVSSSYFGISKTVEVICELAR